MQGCLPLSCNAISMGTGGQILLQIVNPYPEQWKVYQLRYCLKMMLIYIMNKRLASYLDEKINIGNQHSSFCMTFTLGSNGKNNRVTVFLSTVSRNGNLYLSLDVLDTYTIISSQNDTFSYFYFIYLLALYH